jgi:ABC-type multidrug transport system fused ATPase/permease subunit
MTTAAERRRTLMRRPTAEDGPRATFGQLLPYLLEHKKALAVVIALSILSAAAALVQPLLVSQVINVVQAGGAFGGLVWLVVAIVVAAAILSGVQHYLLQRAGTAVVFSARRTLVRRLLNLPIREFDTRRTGDLVSRVGSDTTLLYAVLTQGLVDAIGGALVFVGAIIAMLIIDPLLLGLTVLVIGAAVGTVVTLSRRVRRASQQQQQKVGDLAAAVERALSAIRTVRATNATDREVAAIHEEAEGAYQSGLRVAKASALIVPISGIAMQACFLVVLGVGGFRVAAGEIDVASLVAFVLFLFMTLLPLGQAFGAITSVNQALGALGRIQEIVELPSEREADAGITAAAPVESTAAIAFEDVHFSYPEDAEDRASEGDHVSDPAAMATAEHDPVTHELKVLRGVTFSVPRGSRTALVGPSGAGKSTILALIERFYDPTSGVVRFDGIDIRAMNREELRSQIGYVEQDAPVLAGTLRDNLTLAAPDATDAQCIEVLRAVNLGNVLDRNPLGLDAPVGEEGVMLSGGERQRLAIARTLLAAPPILLLDESTSSLDGLNEHLLREAIDAVAENRTLIVIAHRLSTVVDSDQIVVLERGRVVGVGTHSELVQSTPLYRDLAKHQLLV